MGSYFDLLDNNDDDDDYTLTDYRHLKEIKFNPRVVIFIYAVAGYLLFYKTFLYGN